MSSQTGPTHPSPGRAAARLDGQRSRARILDAAERLLAERGFSGTGIAAISRESGLPASSIYWFFKNKQDLVAAVIERAAERWLESFETPPAAAAPAGAGLRGFLQRALAQSGSRLPDFVRLQVLLGLERGETDPELRERLRRVNERVRPLLASAIAASLADLGSELPAELAEEVSAIAMAFAQGSLVTRHIDPEEIDLEHLADDLEAAVLAVAQRRLARSRS